LIAAAVLTPIWLNPSGAESMMIAFGFASRAWLHDRIIDDLIELG
jgi:hypothetical protein